MSWAASDFRRLLGAAVAATPCSGDNTYHVVDKIAVGPARLLVALSPAKDATILVTDLPGKPIEGFVTRALRVNGHPSVAFDLGGQQFSAGALSIACTEGRNLDVFASLGAELAGSLSSATAPSTELVISLLQRWNRFFAPLRPLNELEELGLWGELWTLTQSSKADVLARGWRGSDGGTFDFFVADRRLEVKASRRPGVHHVSVTQGSAFDDAGFLLSITAERHAAGQSVAELVQLLVGQLSDAAPLLDALARHGMSLATVQAASNRYRVLLSPMLFLVSKVPRIHGMDPGVSAVRYEVHLHDTPHLEGEALLSALGRFGLGALADTI